MVSLPLGKKIDLDKRGLIILIGFRVYPGVKFGLLCPPYLHKIVFRMINPRHIKDT